MGRLLMKPGVVAGQGLAPGGMRIAEELKRLVESYTFDVTITSARDGVHSGPNDPHHSGEALDIRTNDLNSAQKRLLLADLQHALYREPRRFYVFLEDAGGSSEHIHVQRRAGTTYSFEDYLRNL